MILILCAPQIIDCINFFIRNCFMKIIDLTSEHVPLYCICLEDWSDEIKEAGDHKRQWYDKMKDRGLRVKLAVNDEGKAVGMIQYIPCEYAFIEGKDIYFVLCIWVHGHKKGVGNFQKQGIGKALIQAAEEDVKLLGAKGIAAWGLSLPFWMKASWFKKQGYTKVDKNSIQVLMWKPFTDDAIPPVWIREKKKPELVAGQVTVTTFINGWCPAMNLSFERVKCAASEFNDKVTFREIHTDDRTAFLEWGISDAIFINGKQVRTGPPPKFEKLKSKIGKRVKKL